MYYLCDGSTYTYKKERGKRKTMKKWRCGEGDLVDVGEILTSWLPWWSFFSTSRQTSWFNSSTGDGLVWIGFTEFILYTLRFEMSWVHLQSWIFIRRTPYSILHTPYEFIYVWELLSLFSSSVLFPLFWLEATTIGTFFSCHTFFMPSI